MVASPGGGGYLSSYEFADGETGERVNIIQICFCAFQVDGCFSKLSSERNNGILLNMQYYQDDDIATSKGSAQLTFAWFVWGGTCTGTVQTTRGAHQEGARAEQR